MQNFYKKNLIMNNLSDRMITAVDVVMTYTPDVVA